MAKAIPNPELPQNGVPGKQHSQNPPPDAAARREGFIDNSSPLGNLKLWGAYNPLQAGANDSAADSAGIFTGLSSPSGNGTSATALEELEKLQLENTHLRGLIAKLSNAFETNKRLEQEWEQRRIELETLVEEKTELIRELHVKVQELQDAEPPPPPTPKEEELLAMSEELERERCQMRQEQRELDELRKHLADDEQVMGKQMRDMEVQMARERADFARRRSELQRLFEEIRRELENAERNAHLNQRIGHLRQKFQEVAKASPSLGDPKASASGQSDDKKKDNGLLGRLFGK